MCTYSFICVHTVSYVYIQFHMCTYSFIGVHTVLYVYIQFYNDNTPVIQENNTYIIMLHFVD